MGLEHRRSRIAAKSLNAVADVQSVGNSVKGSSGASGIGVVRPHAEQHNVVADSSGSAKDIKEVVNSLEGEQQGDDNDRKVVNCSVPVCPPSVANEQVEGDTVEEELMCGVCYDSEAIVPKSVPEVRSPTQSEVEEHNLNHIPYRSWCAHCVSGRGVERSCTSEGRQPGVLPCIHADYMFMGAKDVQGTTPILVVKDDHTESVFPNVVP